MSLISAKPDAVSLTAEERQQLQDGKAILRQEKGADGGRGIAVQYINATVSNVWDTILDYPEYPDMVKDVVRCSVYEQSRSRGSKILYVEMISKVWGLKFGLYTKNTGNRRAGYMHWSLDRRRTSDVTDLIGYWRVEAV